MDENMISCPLNPHAFDIISSVMEEQSVPHPISFNRFKRKGLGVALTAKYSLYPLFHANACFSLAAFSLIPFSS